MCCDTAGKLIMQYELHTVDKSTICETWTVVKCIYKRKEFSLFKVKTSIKVLGQCLFGDVKCC